MQDKKIYWMGEPDGDATKQNGRWQAERKAPVFI